MYLTIGYCFEVVDICHRFKTAHKTPNGKPSFKAKTEFVRKMSSFQEHYRVTIMLYLKMFTTHDNVHHYTVHVLVHDIFSEYCKTLNTFNVYVYNKKEKCRKYKNKDY